MARDLKLDLIAKMSEDWHEATDAMISMTVGAVLLELGPKEVTINLTTLRERHAGIAIDREYTEHPDGTQYLTFRITEREVTSDDGNIQRPGRDSSSPEGEDGPAAGVEQQ